MKNPIRNTRGMTLVEVIVSFAILSIAFLVMAAGFGAAATLSRRSTDLKNSGGDAFSEAELQASSAEGTDGSLTVGGVPVPGSFKAFTGQAGGDGQDGVTFSLFVPDGWKAGG
ncbi:type II secretion system GspH family protein [Intestinibacillus massiliensis]|uniref:type IV pilus modification PilV family protein n=1 Tax=Intestinibacillus massiliensis TaxID=1871029 RepID=UPI000B361CDB|nr:type II secretion system protein [Intestinibacillus massiliensis]MCB6366260.1 type II secretion system GspH family protein [Intestinibacillus massiliensis]